MNKLGRFALFSIGCIIELIILDLCSFPFSSLTWIQHVLCTFAYPLIMIMLFRIAQKAGEIEKKSIFLCVWGYVALLTGNALSYFPIYVFEYYGEGLRYFGYADMSFKVLAVIMLVMGLTRIARQKKKSLLAFASYILSAALIIDIVESLIYMYIANSGEEGNLNEMYSIHAYLYNFTVYGAVILFLFGLYVQDYKIKTAPFLLRIGSNLVILFSINLMYNLLCTMEDFDFSPHNIGIAVAVIFLVLPVVGGVLAYRYSDKGNRVITVSILSLSIPVVLLSITARGVIPLFPYLLIVSIIFSLIMFIIVHYHKTFSKSL